MILKCVRSVEKSIVSTTMSIDAFGSDTMTSEQERQCLNDWAIKLNFSSILFSRFVGLDANHNPILLEVDDSAFDEEGSGTVEGDRITLAMDAQEVLVDENFEVTYAVDADALKNRVGMYRYLNDTFDIAKAMILVFERTIADKISLELEMNKLHLGDFEDEQIYVV